jgi:hypothetical protein
MSFSVATRQRGLLFDERKVRSFSVGALTKMSSEPPPSHTNRERERERERE